MEYVILEKTEKHGWCLWKLCGTDKEWAEKVLAREQAEHPDKEFCIDEVESKDCWWNDPTLCN